MFAKEKRNILTVKNKLKHTRTEFMKEFSNGWILSLLRSSTDFRYTRIEHIHKHSHVTGSWKLWLNDLISCEKH